MPKTLGLDARALRRRLLGRDDDQAGVAPLMVTNEELRAVVGATLGPGGPVVPEPVLQAMGAGVLAGGLAAAAAAAGLRALLGDPGWVRPTLWVVLAAALAALAFGAAAMRRWAGVPVYRPGPAREAGQLEVGTWVAVAGERRPWQRLVGVGAVEHLGGPYGLVRIVLADGAEVTVAERCRVPLGTLAPPRALLAWPGGRSASR